MNGEGGRETRTEWTKDGRRICTVPELVSSGDVVGKEDGPYEWRSVKNTTRRNVRNRTSLQWKSYSKRPRK